MGSGWELTGLVCIANIMPLTLHSYSQADGLCCLGRAEGKRWVRSRPQHHRGAEKSGGISKEQRTKTKVFVVLMISFYTVPEMLNRQRVLSPAAPSHARCDLALLSRQCTVGVAPLWLWFCEASANRWRSRTPGSHRK